MSQCQAYICRECSANTAKHNLFTDWPVRVIKHIYQPQLKLSYRHSRLNPLECKGNYSATSNYMKFVSWWVGCYIWHSEEGTGRGRSPSRPLLAVQNVTAHPSTATVPIIILPYNGALLCSFNVPIKINGYFQTLPS